MTSDREKWDARWAARDGDEPPHPFVAGVVPFLPPMGRALDVAGGAGRHARLLVARGLDVTVCDVSPVALAKAAAAGAKTMACDLEHEPLPAGPWDVILVAYFLARGRLVELPRELAPGGWLVYVHPTRKNLERHAHPSAQFVVEEGELLRATTGLEVVSFTEGWTETGRHEARLVARRP